MEQKFCGVFFFPGIVRGHGKKDFKCFGSEDADTLRFPYRTIFQRFCWVFFFFVVCIDH